MTDEPIDFDAQEPTVNERTLDTLKLITVTVTLTGDEATSLHETIGAYGCEYALDRPTLTAAQKLIEAIDRAHPDYTESHIHFFGPDAEALCSYCGKTEATILAELRRDYPKPE